MIMSMPFPTPSTAHSTPQAFDPEHRRSIVFDLARREIITILGSGFDDRNRVLFDGIPAPITYAPSDQINAVVPFELTGPSHVDYGVDGLDRCSARVS